MQNEKLTGGRVLIKKLLIAMTICFFAGVAFAYPVAYNTKSHIYHKQSCDSAKKCTKNCVTVEDSTARARGGRPCKVCGK